MKSNVFRPMLSACGASACPPFTSPAARLSRTAAQIGQVEAIQQAGRPGRQRIEHPLNIGGEIVLAGLHLGVEAEASCSSEAAIIASGRITIAMTISTVAAAARFGRPPILRCNCPVQRRKNDGDDDGPENGAIERRRIQPKASVTATSNSRKL